MEYTLQDRELSWLHFNGRVLQEAEDPSVPLFERLFFCGVFSSNLDEYFRVRVASLRSLLRLGKGDVDKLGIDPHRLLHEIHRLVLAQQERYGGILREIFRELAEVGIHVVTQETVSEDHGAFLRESFRDSIRPLLDPLRLDGGEQPPFLENRAIYLVVELWEADATRLDSWVPDYALVEVPSRVPRFVTLPSLGDRHEVMYVDDVIRYNLPELFSRHEVGRSWAVKLTRDAELPVEDEFEGDLVEAIRRSLGRRSEGVPSRFLYDMRAPYVVVHRLQRRLGLDEEDLVLGARYHNLSDYMSFPRFGLREHAYPEWPPLAHPVLEGVDSILSDVRERDRVVHFPYQSFDYVLRFLEEAAGDPRVEEIWLTVYRVAGDSAVLTAILDAARAGKNVTTFMEVQARFDEESNLAWGDRLEAAGVRTLYSMRGLKVHAKIALVVRREETERKRYAFVGTGNFNEKTSRIYADHGVFTSDERITRDVEQVFRFLAGEISEPETEHLLVAPFTLREGFYDLIAHEAGRAEAGEPSGMTLKMNALEDEKIIRRLYEASGAGVPIDVIVRGICRLVPGRPDQSETVRARSILDRYLEHARIYRFHHDGEERLYLASADWMKRNLSRRVEVAMPLYDAEVRRQMGALLEIQLADNTKARRLDSEGANAYLAREEGEEPIRAQAAFRGFLADLS